MAGKPDKETQKRLKAEKRAASKQRRAQIWQAFQMQRKQDKLLLPLMIGSVVGAAVVAFLIGLIFGLEWIFLVFGVAIGVMIAISIFGRRVQRSVYAQADGQPGAAGWALDQLRGQWRVTQGVAGTTHLDAVHRVVGRPGVVLVAEGAPHRVKSLLAQEKKRTARVVGDTPIYDITIGTGEGDVRLAKLNRYLLKLPANLSKDQVGALEKRLSALGGSRAIGLPKGPMPQGAKMRNVQRTVRRRT
jgi:F0F1-type ATP synthase assembly protein I